MGRANGLKGFENIKNARLVDKQMTVENDLLTPTFKAKRDNIKSYFADSLNEMYLEIGDQEIKGLK